LSGVPFKEFSIINSKRILRFRKCPDFDSLEFEIKKNVPSFKKHGSKFIER